MSATGRIALRPVTAGDERFLVDVYASTREQELSMLTWSERQKSEFVRSQHEAQRAHHVAHHPQASFRLILVDGESAGRLYVDRAAERIHLIDIALLPRFRGEGVGEALLLGLIDEAEAGGVPLTAYVERHNRALSLYRRLGFREVEDGEVYQRIERPPGGAV
jgi:ribosomal protein S18 acetylase RimI-like enzyme